MQFQRELEELGKFVEMLPFDDNTDSGNQTTIDPSTNNTVPDGADPSQDSPDTPKPRKHWKPSLLRIWDFMQSAVCGKEPKKKGAASSSDSSEGDDDDNEPVDIGEGFGRHLERDKSARVFFFRFFFSLFFFFDIEPVFSVTFMGCFVVGGEFCCCCWGVFGLLLLFLGGGNFLLRACVQWDVFFLSFFSFTALLKWFAAWDLFKACPV